MKKPIVLFDGVCGLCHHFINLLLKIDKEGYFLISTLQGEFAKKHLPVNLRGRLDTVVLYDQGKVYTQSDAVLIIFNHLGGGWRILSHLRIIPKKLRDALYEIISKNRYRLFGKKESCHFPSSECKRLIK